MSMPTIEELTACWEAGYYEHFRNTGKSALDGRTAGVAAVRDAILDDLIAEAERMNKTPRRRRSSDHFDLDDVPEWLRAMREEGP